MKEDLVDTYGMNEVAVGDLVSAFPGFVQFSGELLENKDPQALKK